MGTFQGEVGSFKKEKVMCRNSNEGNKRWYKSIKYEAKNAVSKAMREKAEEALIK